MTPVDHLLHLLPHPLTLTNIDTYNTMSSPPNPFASSPSPQSSPLPSSPRMVPTPPRSGFSAASGSPPPTHRASFPDPASEPKGAKLGDRLVGPKAKEGPCCDKDRDIAKGEEIHIIDAFKTTEGGKASYITYVIQLGVSTSKHIKKRAAHCLDTPDTKAILVLPQSTSSLNRSVSGIDHSAYPIKAVACRVRGQRSVQSQRGCYDYRSKKEAARGFLAKACQASYPRW